jgi:Thioredoxin domain-containing protein
MEKAVVLFYASWCPFSQRFLPIFKEYAKRNPDICLSVIVEDDPGVFKEYTVEYYPTVIMFKKGKMCKRLDPESGVGLTEEKFKNFAEGRLTQWIKKL